MNLRASRGGERLAPKRAGRSLFQVLAVGRCRAATLLLERMALDGLNIQLHTSFTDGAEVCALYDVVPDLILIDADSPLSPVASLCESFKRNRDTLGVPLIVVSASIKACEGALDHGADDLVTPQIPLALQIKRIAALIQVRQSRHFLLLEDGFGVLQLQAPQWRDGITPPGSLPDNVLDYPPTACIPATVLFADLRGYSNACDGLEPAAVVLLLREYFSLLTQITLDYGGTVFHTAGDGLMAGFVSAEPSEAANRALGAAQTMVSRFAPLAGTWLVRFGTHLGLGVGLDSGEVALARTGPSLVTRSTLTGRTVNEADRLCQTAGIGEIALSAAFKDNLSNPYPASSLVTSFGDGEPSRESNSPLRCLPAARPGVPSAGGALRPVAISADP